MTNIKNPSKQETLEEAAEKYAIYSFDSPLLDASDNFKAGVEWHKNQVLDFLYREVIERRPYSATRMCEEVIKFIEKLK